MSRPPLRLPVALCLLALALGGGAGCGGPSLSALSPAGTYHLDRVGYALSLWRAEDAARAEKAPGAGDESWEAARRAAATVALRLDIRPEGTFVVRYRFGSERGARRGAWRQDGDQVVLQITHDAAGPIQSGAVVTARMTPEGLRFQGWPVPYAFLLRPE